MDLIPWEATLTGLAQSWGAGLWMAAAVFGSGFFFIRNYPGERLEKIVVAYGVGLAVMQPLAVALTLAGFLTPYGVGLILLPGAFMALRLLTRLSFPNLQLSFLDASLLGLALILLLADLLVSLAPVANHDALTAHAYLPDLWAMAHRIVATPWSFATHNMQGAHILLALPLSLGPIEGGKFFQGLTGAIGLIGVFELGRIFGGERAGLLGLLLAGTMFTTILLFHNLQLDLFVATMNMGLLLAVLRILKGENHVAQATLIFGGMVAIKYNALSWLPLAAAAIYWCRGRIIASRFLVRATAAAAFFMSPWLVRNWLAERNPFFPFFEANVEFWNITSSTPQTADDLLEAAANVLGFGLTSEIMGLLFVALIPGCVVGFRKLDRAEKTLAVMGLLGLGIWALFSRAPWQLTRFYLGGFWLLCAFSARGLAARRWGILLALCVILLNGFNTWTQMIRSIGSLPVALGVQSRTNHILEFDPGRPVRQATRDSAVFALSMYAYGLGPRSVAPFIYDAAEAAPYFKNAHDAAELARRLRADGFTHLLIDYAHLESLRTSGFDFIDTDSGALPEAMRSWPLSHSSIVPGYKPGTIRGAALWEIPS